MQELKEDFKTLDLFFESCSIDYQALKAYSINEDFLVITLINEL